MPMPCCQEFYDKIPEDEPIFILAARDITAPGHVQAWIDKARALGVNDNKVAHAVMHLKWMQDWQARNPQLVKTPD